MANRCFTALAMHRLLYTAILVVGLGGCSFVRLWNPVYDRMEFDRSVVFNERGVVINVMNMAFINGGSPMVNYRLTNATDSPITYRPASVRLIAGADTVLPSGILDAQTILPNETARFTLSFERPEAEKEARGTVLVLALGEVETTKTTGLLPEVRFVVPSADFEGGRVWPHPAVAR